MSGTLATLVVAFAAAIYSVSATPIAVPPPCETHITYKVTSQKVVTHAPECVPGEPFLDPDPSGGSLSAGKTFSKTASFTGGISETFKLADVFSFGATQSVTIAFGTADSLTVSEACPPNIECGLTASVDFLHVVGTQTQSETGWCGESLYTGNPPPKTVPFTADYPVLKNGNMNVLYSACTVGKGDSPLLPCPCTAPNSPEPAPKPAPAPAPKTGPRSCSITGSNVNHRTGPSTNDASNGQYNSGQSIAFTCKTTGQSVSGNTAWDKTSTGDYVSQVYVEASCAALLPNC